MTYGPISQLWSRIQKLITTTLDYTAVKDLVYANEHVILK